MRLKPIICTALASLARLINRQSLILLAQESALTVILIYLSVDVQPDGTVRLGRWPLGIALLICWSVLGLLRPAFQHTLPVVLRMEVRGWRCWSFQIFSLLWMSLLAVGLPVPWAFVLAGSIEPCLAGMYGWKVRAARKVHAQRQAPACVFPVRNESTGRVVWFELAKSAYGLYVTVHQQRPSLEHASSFSPGTAMAAVHVDYFLEAGAEETEQIKVQLWDEQAGPDGDPGWGIPAARRRLRNASIVLVADVQKWRPPTDEEEGSQAHDE